MGLNILRKFLHLPADHDAFVRPDTIKLPAKFDNAAYKKVMVHFFPHAGLMVVAVVGIE